MSRSEFVRKSQQYQRGRKRGNSACYLVGVFFFIILTLATTTLLQPASTIHFVHAKPTSPDSLDERAFVLETGQPIAELARQNMEKRQRAMEATQSALVASAKLAAAPPPLTISTTLREADQPPAGIKLDDAARAVLLRGCSADSKTNSEGVACSADGLGALLDVPPESRFSPSMRNPCTATDKTGQPSVCVPYFYILGAFHAGVRDLMGRLQLHPEVVQPRARVKEEAYPFYFTETHPWDRMLWRGCDYGRCPSRRGAGAEPIRRADFNELNERAVFGEAAGGEGAGSNPTS